MTTPTALYRVNCGAPKDYTDRDGNRWLADQEFAEGKSWGAIGGSAVVRGHRVAVESRIALVYQCERYGAMEYRFDVPAGRYDVQLHFAETCPSNFVVGARVFSVTIGDKPIAMIDPLRDAGGLDTPYVLTIPGVLVEQDVLSINLGKNAIVNGIEITSHVPTPDERRYVDFTHPQKATDQFNFAKFRLWTPDDSPLRAVISILPGLGGDGRRWTEAPMLQQFARQHRLGIFAGFVRLLESHWPERQRGNTDAPFYWKVAQSGLGEAFESALADCARQSQHPELQGAPLLMFGHSAGGKTNFHFAEYRPQRVLGFVTDRSMQAYDFTTTSADAARVPGLFIAGERDDSHRDELAFRKFREIGALWSIATEQRGDHGMADDLSLVLPFFERVLHYRLPIGATDLHPVPSSQLFRGHNQSFAISPLANSQTDPDYSVLLDETFATQWKGWVSAKRDPFELAER